MKAWAALLAIAISGNAVAQDQGKPDCNKESQDEVLIQMYQGCIADRAEKYETGDTPDNVATAAVTGCGPFKTRLIEYVTICEQVSGTQIVDSLEQSFHAFGVQAVMESRAKRIEAANRRGR
jgi:hypothetical protein